MEQNITIKSYKNGLALFIREDCPYEDIISEIAEKFATSRSFFGKGKVTLSLEGPQLTPYQENHLIETIQKNSDLEIVCMIGKDQELQILFDQALTQVEYEEPEEETAPPNAFLHRGNVVSGTLLESAYPIIILGDVEEGARVYAEQDVIALGAIYGNVEAGMDQKLGHFVAAMELSPERLVISGDRYKKKAGKSLFSDHGKKGAKIAVSEDGSVIIKPVSADFLQQIVTIQKRSL